MFVIDVGVKLAGADDDFAIELGAWLVGADFDVAVRAEDVTDGPPETEFEPDDVQAVKTVTPRTKELKIITRIDRW